MIKSSDLIDEKIVFTDRITRSAYARDASMYRLMPESVVKPRNIHDVRNLLEFANASKTPVTFRAGGTSLSGQSVSNSIIAEILHNWKKFKILDNGKSIHLEPGVVAAHANSFLSPYKTKLGPDPASINSATIGGILSNNSSGMVCGTEFNAYHTLKSLSFMLPNGNVYNTDNPNENERFIQKEKILCATITKIKETIKTDSKILNTIRNKYRIKNTIGYSMNAFIDFDRPIDIFSHLLIGSEGTLGFIISTILNTIQTYENIGTGLIIFNSPEEACKAIPFYKDLGAKAIEFLDDASLRTAVHYKNSPYKFDSIMPGSTGILIEYQHEFPNEINSLIKETKKYSDKNSNIRSTLIVTDKNNRDIIWKIRKGLYPTIGALREDGKSVITEDIAVDVGSIAPVINELKRIFTKRKFHDGVIFGHAKDGNLHFITSVDFNSDSGIKNYEFMMNDLADLTLNRYNGSLKAEHGTGRNMAPFVETEWGGPIYEMMWKLKKSIDPNGILNPNVLLSSDPKIHLKNIKKTPLVNKIVDSCVECGFCENICPSRGYTFTPRQRIAIMRETQGLTLQIEEEKILQHGVSDTCVTDGLCAIECPVNIDTGKLVKELRSVRKKEGLLLGVVVKKFNLFITLIRFLLKLFILLQKVIGESIFNKLSNYVNKISENRIPIIPVSKIKINKIGKIKKISNPDYIVFPTCINRVVSTDNSDVSSSEYIVKIAEKASLKVLMMDKSHDLCCGMAFSSKGYTKSGGIIQGMLIDQIKNAYRKYNVPIIIDMSPCTETIRKSMNFEQIKIMDSLDFLNTIKSRLSIKKLNLTCYVHSVCSDQPAGPTSIIHSIAQNCVEAIEDRKEDFCCGMGGDRGLMYPDLTKNSIKRSAHFPLKSTIGVSSSRTCEIALSNELGIEFISIEALVYRSLKN